ncbi:fructuronate reductase [Enterobacterales bacterium CwR94]|nr:fructuronate reductase [Enterobacterales bacterium CwR94]
MLVLNTLPATLPQPRYARQQLRTRIAHVGFGAFFRAHQALCTEQLANEQHSDWGYCVINLHSGEGIQALREQDFYYSVAVMDEAALEVQVAGIITQAVHGAGDGIDAVIEALCQPDIAIVSLTITEKGYCHSPATGKLNRDHPDIVHDIAHPLRPRSVPGILLAAIITRKSRHLPPFSVLSCDNMPENGRVTRDILLQLAAHHSDDLGKWIADNIRFPSTMVDRIVPATTPDTLAALERQLGSYDPLGVACEPFFQWVIEDNFAQGRPRWELAGAQLVADVLPWEQMKLRMLNGSHSFLAYLGQLAGYEHVCDCMQDDALRTATRQLMLEEQAPTLEIVNVDLAAYADSLIQRYENKAIKHRTAQIANDGSQKLPQRWLDSIRWHIDNGSAFDWLALGVAGWMHYVSGTDQHGRRREINDPLSERIAAQVAASTEDTSRVTALLSLTEIFGETLPATPIFVERVSDFYLQLVQQGAHATLQQAISLR